ncbi:hypothetical protein OD91_0137 [Lutibacter sp. Hel_I_33_5]|uniref:hypothetical protein n=1 Tax=Lutibacter sp. Hel_I_33_5 TaxID=1566289 RepID=UPI0011A02760|nr:hypothetical protein [Lutibacter sp. Hel_I_33_5]TVZ54900.1 hypothetical protein OD91_0137 [Lutibacter sp. Hel_I_33_5]
MSITKEELVVKRNISGKKVFWLFILTNLVYAFMLMVTIPNTMAFSNGMKLLDMMPTGYDFNYVNKLFSDLGDNGRETYLTSQIPVDMVYPLLFGVSYCLLMAYLLKKINKLKPFFYYLCLLPIIAGIADYIENMGIITMLKTYPDITETTVTTTNMFSVIKSISTSVFFFALIVILILVGISFFKKSIITT